MTISLSWVRRSGDTVELIVASDSRLRSQGAMDQAQKIFKLDRGDCCLGFCGDATLAYPFFIQAGTAINSYFKHHTRATDFSDLIHSVEDLLNSLYQCWDLGADEKFQSTKDTKIIFSGWSWKNKKYMSGLYKLEKSGFNFHKKNKSLPHRYCEKSKSLIFAGDYESDFSDTLQEVLDQKYSENRSSPLKIDLDYEPLQALNLLLTRKKVEHSAIGGAPQILKVYQFGSSLPLAVQQHDGIYLFGRKLFDWEKTTFPIMKVDITDITTRYPMEDVSTTKAILCHQNLKI